MSRMLAPSHITLCHKGKGGQFLEPRGLRDWFKTTAYIGEGGYPRIIEQDVWDEAQKTLSIRRERKHGGPTPKEPGPTGPEV